MWQRSEDWIGSHVDDSFVMINLDHGTYVALNPTAADAWDLLGDPQDEEALVCALINKYEVDPGHCRDAVHALLTDMIARGLVRVVP